MRTPHSWLTGGAALALGALGVFGSVPATAFSDDDCEPHFVDPVYSINAVADEFGPSKALRESVTLRIRNDDDDDDDHDDNRSLGAFSSSDNCAAYLRIAERPGRIGDELEFTFVANGRSLEILPDPSVGSGAGSDLPINPIPEGASGRKLRLNLIAPTPWGLGAGQVQREYLLSLVDEAGREYDRAILRVSIQIAPAVALRIVGASGRGSVRSINLGFLDPKSVNRSDPFGLRVWSTTAYRVEFLSENRGVLRHVEDRGTIPYELWMDGTRLDLSTTAAMEFPEKTSSLGDLHRLQILVQPFFSRAGQYRDRVEVTVSAI